MKQCEFCGANMAKAAGFCDKCGRLPSRISRHATHISDFPTLHTGDATYQDNNQTILSVSSQNTALRAPGAGLRPITLLPIDDKSEEEKAKEEKHRRAALFGMGLPLYDESNNEEAEEEERRRADLSGMGFPLLEEIANHPTLGQAPALQGTPQMAHVPAIPNTPQVAHVPAIPNTPQIHGGAAFGPGAPTIAGNPPLLPHIQPLHPLLLPPPKRPLRPFRNTTGQRHLSGCLPLGAIFLATILIILLTTVGLSLTTFAPGLALSGNSTVTPGSDLSLHGHNFLPNSSVTLTLDNGAALPSTRDQSPTQLTRRALSTLPDTALTLDMSFIAAEHNTIPTLSNGTFTAIILVSSSWTSGHHTIYAREAVSHRSASLPFTIAQADAPATPTAIPTATQPVPTTTPSPTPTATATPPPTLSCVTPGHLSLGPISEFSSQLVSTHVILCATGSGTLTWKAGWNQKQSPWLQVKQSSGSIQAPNQIQTTISASAAKLAAGTYTTSITFTGIESNTSQTVNVTLTVQAGCVSATPQSLSFTGVEGISDPGSAQNISITNCGLASTWSATSDNGSNWLSLSSSRGTFQNGATKTIAVTASNLNAKLKAGTYQDTITFAIGSDTTTVKVSLIVQAAPPSISASPTSLDAASSPCTTNENSGSTCTITLTNQSSTAALTWSANTDGSGVSVQADSATIPAGGTEQVTITVPASNCGTALTITFKAPENSASVTWNCTPQTPPPIR